ncbi:unnamed protein product [Rhizoctonia solani]|uniref:CHAT domain-containing protein n=1 Tax=Rhizoctonia solani TaxID=456999 RepID=A0A8H2X8S7_9AGAM|nr:unnamed protein product [Rhizoctonia solani]
MHGSYHLSEEARVKEIEKLLLRSCQEDGKEAWEHSVAQVLDELEQIQPSGPDECAVALSVINNLLSNMDSNSAEEEDFDLQYSDLLVRCQTLALSYSSHDLEDMIGWLHDLGLSFDSRFEGLGDIKDVNMAIDYREKAVGKLPEGHSRLLELLDKLGISYLDRFSELKDPVDLDNAIQRISRAISMFPDNDTTFNRPASMNNLGVAYSQRFGLSKRLEDIDASIELQLNLMSLTPAQSGIGLIYILNLGGRYYQRFLVSKHPVDIEKAIEYQSLVISLAPEGNEQYISWLHLLSDYYRDRFKHFYQLEDIDGAIKHRLKGISLSDDEANDEYPMWLDSLGVLYHERFKYHGETPDLDCAIEYLSRAKSLVDPDDPDEDIVFQIFQDLSLSYVSRFERFGNLEDIELAIRHQAHAILIAPQSDKNLYLWLMYLGDSYDARYDHFGNDEDLEIAVELYWQSLLLTSKEHEDRPRILQQLGCAYSNRFQQQGELYNVDKAITYQSQALRLLPAGGSYRTITLGNLGISYLRRFERSGNLGDIKNAIEYQSQAISLTPKNHTKRQLWLGNLGNAYSIQYEHLGKLKDIDAAIEHLTEAISLTPSDHSAITLWLNNLGLAHWDRFERLEEMEDIDKAIAYHSQALSLPFENASRRALLLSNLGNSYGSRFERLHHSDDIDKAITHQYMAVSITPPDNALRPHRLGNLGNSYWNRAESLGDEEDLVKAIDYHLQAVSALPPGHASLPLWLVGLGKAYASRFTSSGNNSDIESAIEYQTMAVDLTPPYHGDAPEWIYWLARSQLLRFQSIPEVGSLEKTIKYFEMSAQSTIGNPQYIFRSACHWAQLTSAHQMPGHLLAYQRAMDLVPHLVWLGSSIDKRYSDVPKLGNLALEAAMAAISAKRYSLALEWLEQGRSIVWNQVLQLRTPLDQLSLVDPTLAEKLGYVASQLLSAPSIKQKPVTPSKKGAPLEEPNHKHRRLAEEYDQLVTRVRKLEGFENFLLPKKSQELLYATYSGPIVVVNVHPSRCDALILQPSRNEVLCISLASLSYEKIVQACDQLRYTLSRQDIRHRDSDISRRPFFEDSQNYDGDFEDILKMLWHDLTKPVLEFLGYKPTLSGGDLPRITWCTTGPLSFLPLHATGCYDLPGERLFHYAISSYTPTVGALLSSASVVSRTSNIKRTSLLAVGLEVTPGCNDLPNVIRELDHIRGHSGELGCYTQLEGSSATVEAVLAAMEMHDWIHLACHAHQNGQKPSESGFFLQNGELTLATIARKAFKNKGLAFLSACQTAAGDRIIADEAVHLASGMLMAGYPSVIATMWSIMDADAPLIADTVYGLLRDEDMDCSDAAWALHAAVSILRAEVGERAFGRWIPFIHVGI